MKSQPDMHSASRQRVLALAVDAPNHALLQKWMDEGALPNLARLREASQCFLLQSQKASAMSIAGYLY